MKFESKNKEFEKIFAIFDDKYGLKNGWDLDKCEYYIVKRHSYLFWKFLQSQKKEK